MNIVGMLLRFLFAIVLAPLGVLLTGRIIGFILNLGLYSAYVYLWRAGSPGPASVFLLLAIIHACFEVALYYRDVREGNENVEHAKGGLAFLLIIIGTAGIFGFLSFQAHSKNGMKWKFPSIGGGKAGAISREPQMRDWTDSQGRVTRAKLISKSANSVTLESADGKSRSVPLDAFSLADQEYVRQLKSRH